jgi:hypothetical protein
MVENNMTSRIKLILLLAVGILTTQCGEEIKPEVPAKTNSIEGTWKLTYAEIRENDSVQVKDMSSTDFIKIINQSHFAFFNQERGTDENFTAGAGTYEFDGSNYVENLDFINYLDYRGHSFSFEVEIREDSLIQQGQEKIEESGINRYILEKYVRVKN